MGAQNLASTKRDIHALAVQNWSLKRELARLAGLIGFTILALASSSIALFVMWLPINDVRDPWQLFTGGNPLGEGLYFWVPVLVAAAMFVSMIRGAINERLVWVPHLRRPK